MYSVHDVILSLDPKVKRHKRGVAMRLCRLLITVFAFLAANGVPILAQTPAVGSTSKVISVNDPRPLSKALEALEHEYWIPITYEDPEYVHLSDTQDVTEAVSKHPENGVRVIIPKGGSFQFQYAIKNDKPQENIKSLIQRMLAEHAAQGGPIFDVQERLVKNQKNGTEWHVIPVRFRNASGQFVDQLALLDNIVNIQQGKRGILDIIGDMCQQLSQVSGRRVGIGLVPMNVLGGYEVDYGATNRRARDVLAELLDKPGRMAWQLFYDPGQHVYMLNIHVVANLSTSRFSAVRSPSAPPSGAKLSATTSPSQPRMFLPRLYGRVHTPEGISAIQSALAGAGYYKGQPTGVWDPATIDATKAYQIANKLNPTGVPDPLTVHKLNLDTDATVPNPQHK
jgi:hypothetical protein